MLPDDVARLIRGFQPSRVLLTAIELNVFTAIGEGATAEEVAAKLNSDPRATGMLLNALAALGLLSKNGGAFRNTPVTARFLDDASPESERLAWMHSVHMWKSWSTLTDCVRAGTSVSRREGAAPDAAWTAAFIAAMHRNATERAPLVWRPRFSTARRCCRSRNATSTRRACRTG